jgi:hypothetical protein
MMAAAKKFPIKSAGHAKAWRIGSARTKAAMTKPEQQDTETEVYVSLRQLKKFRGRSPMIQKVRPCTQV